MSTKQTNARMAVLAMGGLASPAALAATEAYTFVIAKIKQKNGLNFKLIDAVDIDWQDFDWAGVNLPTYTLPVATDKVLGGVKVGANITKTDDGTISVSADNIKTALGFTPADSAKIPAAPDLTPYVKKDGSVPFSGDVKVQNIAASGEGENAVPASDYAIKFLGVPGEDGAENVQGTLTATNYSGTAAKATADADGNVIKDTYAKKQDIPAAYALPVATDKVLGGVKVGANITKADDGTISVTAANVNGALGYTAGNDADAKTLQPYFDRDSVKKFGGHTAGYYATAEQVTALQNGMTWLPPVADTAALKAVAAPKDTDARLTSTDPDNVLWIFNAQATATADSDSVIIPADKTAGAWIKQGTVMYGPATANADGLMTAAMFVKLNAFDDAGAYAKAADLANKVDKVDGKGLSANDFTNDYKAKLDGYVKMPGIFFASVDIGSDTDVKITDLNLPEGYSPAVGMAGFDSQGGKYVITKINDDGTTVHCGPVGLQLALKASVDAKADKPVGGDLTGALPNPTIKDGAITDTKIAAASLSSSKLFVPDGDVLILDGGSATA